MRIESFTIKNYRSIQKLKIDNLNSVNVFFGKNNVGKSNILRGLHLAFYSLKNGEIFLPDTMFYNRNIYKPIEITVDLILEEDFCDTEEVNNALAEGIENIYLVAGDEEEMFRDIITEVNEFIENSKSFKPVRKLHLKMQLDYNEERSDIRFSIEDLESDYKFDYGKYKNLYENLKDIIDKKISDEKERIIEPFLSELSLLGLDVEEIYPSLREIRYRFDFRVIDPIMSRLRRYITKIKEPAKRKKALFLLDQYRETLREPRGKLIEPFSRTFNIVEEYFEKISDNFVLIPNKEYFLKGPFEEKDGEQIEIFDMDKFIDRLLSLIGSPNRRGRELIQKFYSIFNQSYSDLGKLETITKVRDEIFVIFGTSLTSLPVEEQGLGIQDLFLYLAHMILFDSAIVAIEEPEGGLSTENQSVLHNIIEDVYSGSDKQIFISSHSEEFETPNSYIIEMGKDGTKEISRIKKEKEYEEKIGEVLIKRKLAEEKERYEALLKEFTERQMALDILNYIDKLDDEEKIDAQKISNELGYKKEKVQEILKEITKEK